MEQQTFHGDFRAEMLAQALLAEFNHGNIHCQVVGRGDQVMVQIASQVRPASGGQTAISVHLQDTEDGVHIRLGQQQWLGVAASLGLTAVMALRNPLSLLGRLDDVAQDLASLQLSARIWETIERAAHASGASRQISDRLRRLTCPYCLTANPVGDPHCLACGAPLGPQQPAACRRCGFVTNAGAGRCPECGAVIG
jgi:hypothetical protein